jgi:hypothetical protein
VKQASSALLGIDLAAGGVALAISALVYFAGVAPSIQAVQAAADERVELTRRKADADSLEKSLRNTTTKLEDLERADAGSARSASGTALDRIGRISAIAAEAGVSLTDLSPKQEQPGARFNRIPITISGQGQAPAFGPFLKRLHAEFPDTQVASMSISSTPEAREAPASFSAELVWYTVAKVAGQSDKSVSAANAGGAGAPPQQPR